SRRWAGTVPTGRAAARAGGRACPARTRATRRTPPIGSGRCRGRGPASKGGRRWCTAAPATSPSLPPLPCRPGTRGWLQRGAGGVGLLLTQIAKLRGAHVITTVSTEDKAALSRGAGADLVILYTKQDFEAEVKTYTRGKGVAVVYDSVGITTFEKSINILQP